MTARKLKKGKLGEFLAELSRERVVYGPVRSGNLLVVGELSGSQPLLDTSIADRPPKDIFFPQTEVLLTYSKGEAKDVPYSGRPTAVFGIRPCDARAFALLDRMFLGEPLDTYWQARRKGALVISIGCNSPASTCFCHWTGGGPFDEEGSDVALTDIGEAFVAKACTPAGEEALGKSEMLADATADELSEANRLKQDAEARLSAPVDATRVKKALEALWEDELWDEFSGKCLACAACTYLCPTCHCFDVQDEGTADSGRRIRIWDSCMFGLFTKEASGHNPRVAKKQRLRQRVMHKFSYFQDRFGAPACVGCGRCVRACPANVDLRAILQEVVERGLHQ